MISSDDFLQTCNITSMLSGYVSTKSLMQEYDSKWGNLFKQSFYNNSELKNITNPSLPLGCVKTSCLPFDIGRICG